MSEAPTVMQMNGVIDLIHRGYESKDLDYKGPVSWDWDNDQAGCCELVKDILAMANTAGGYIVVGVCESKDGFLPVGLAPEQLASFETTRLNQFVQRYADPPINCRVAKIESRFVVIEVPVFSETPHLCAKDYPKVLSAHTLYVRTDNNESAPIASSADFRRLLAQAVRNSHDELLFKLDSLLSGRSRTPDVPADDLFREQIDAARKRFQEKNPYAEKAYGAYVEFVFQPEQFSPKRFSIEDLRRAAERGFEDFRGWPFLFISGKRPECTYNIADGVETLISWDTFKSGNMVDFWRFMRSGMFYQRKLVWEDTHSHTGQQGRLLDWNYNIRYFAEAIHCLVRLYEELMSSSEVIRADIRFVGMEGRMLVDLSNNIWLPRGECVSHEDVVMSTRSLTLVEWAAALPDHAAEMATELCNVFNWTPRDGFLRKVCEDHLQRRG